MHFYYNVSHLTDTERILAAEFHVFKMRPAPPSHGESKPSHVVEVRNTIYFKFIPNVMFYYIPRINFAQWCTIVAEIILTLSHTSCRAQQKMMHNIPIFLKLCPFLTWNITFFLKVQPPKYLHIFFVSFYISLVQYIVLHSPETLWYKWIIVHVKKLLDRCFWNCIFVWLIV